MDPETDARALVLARFRDARAAFLGGGVLSARRTPTSDMDIVVILGGPPAPYRESLIWRNWPVEIFAQRTDTRRLVRQGHRPATAVAGADVRGRRDPG